MLIRKAPKTLFFSVMRELESGAHVRRPEVEVMRGREVRIELAGPAAGRSRTARTGNCRACCRSRPGSCRGRCASWLPDPRIPPRFWPRVWAGLRPHYGPPDSVVYVPLSGPRGRLWSHHGKATTSSPFWGDS
ncbi:hypothetical protein LUX39_11850 [Actinomadura madurae]|nr:hypothetical protein [Actinomadura madurae]